MRTVLLTVLEVACVLVVLYGVAAIYVPAALILGGLVGVVAVEQKLAASSATHRKEPGS